MIINNGLPMSYNEFNLVTASVSPSTAHCQNNLLTEFFAHYLLQDVMSVFDFTLPAAVPKRYFKYVLFCNGWIIGTYDNKYGAIAHYGTIEGYDWYHRPINSTIRLTHSDPSLNFELKRKLNGIGQDACLIGLQDDYSSIIPLVLFYAERMALIYESFDTNIINSKLAYVFGTDNKALSETFKKLFDNIQAGNVACVVDKDLFSDDYTPRWQAFFNNLKANYIGSDLLLDLTKIRKEFCTRIGIPNANTDKRERLTDDEVNSNNQETLTLVETWRDNINEGLTRLGELFPDWSGSEVRLKTGSLKGLIEGVTEGDDFSESEV